MSAVKQQAGEIFSPNELLLSAKRIPYQRKNYDLETPCPVCGKPIVIQNTQPWHWHTIRCELATLEFYDLIRRLAEALEVQNEKR